MVLGSPVILQVEWVRLPQQVSGVRLTWRISGADAESVVGCADSSVAGWGFIVGVVIWAAVMFEFNAAQVTEKLVYSLWGIPPGILIGLLIARLRYGPLNGRNE